jgi:hypothetical protein
MHRILFYAHNMQTTYGSIRTVIVPYGIRGYPLDERRLASAREHFMRFAGCYMELLPVDFDLADIERLVPFLHRCPI